MTNGDYLIDICNRFLILKFVLLNLSTARVAPTNFCRSTFSIFPIATIYVSTTKSLDQHQNQHQHQQHQHKIRNKSTILINTNTNNTNTNTKTNTNLN